MQSHPAPPALNARRLAFRSRAEKQVRNAGDAMRALGLLAQHYRSHYEPSDATALVDTLRACVDQIEREFSGSEPAPVKVEW